MRVLASLLLTLTLLVSTDPATAVTSPEPARYGVWPLPPRPEVVLGFDPPAVTWGPGHRGVDLLGQVGQQVRASLGGRVGFAGKLAGRGVVVVDHGEVRTTYEPVSASVHAGDLVGPGEAIGTLQRASSHCFPRACLHWGLLRGESYLDPLTLVGAGAIRLLPLVRGPESRLTGWRPVRPGGAPADRPAVAGPW